MHYTIRADPDLPHPRIPLLSEERINFLKTLVAPTKGTALHIAKVINNLTLSILMRCSPFASPLGLGNPLKYMTNGPELRKKDPNTADILDKPCVFTRGLRKPQKEELIRLNSFPGIPEEGEFSEAWDVIGALQQITSAEPPSFVKEGTKCSEGVVLGNTTEVLKEYKKRLRGLLHLKSSSSKVLEMKGSPELKKSDPLSVQKDRKDNPVSFPEQRQKKQKHIESQAPLGRFFSFSSIDNL